MSNIRFCGKTALLGVLLTALTLAACGKRVYEDAFKPGMETVFTHVFNENCHTVFRAARNALRQQGFRIDSDDNKDSMLEASREWQVNDDTSAKLDIQVSRQACDKSKSTINIIARETHIKSSESIRTADLGGSFAGFGAMLPVPIGHEQTSAKKLGETVTDKVFYERFFAAIENAIPDAKASIEQEGLDRTGGGAPYTSEAPAIEVKRAGEPTDTQPLTPAVTDQDAAAAPPARPEEPVRPESTPARQPPASGDDLPPI
ncbi:MAG: DUF2242 domain-containing protein [Methylococcaceae bacterium]|nr:MAG: DUF2242 domain-containing protein [Methylococcaceae bacterium]